MGLLCLDVGVNPYRRIIESTGWEYANARRAVGTDPLWQFLDEPMLPDILVDNKDKYKIDEKPQSVEGNDCWHVAWLGMDELWLDPS